MRLRRGEQGDADELARIKHACYSRMTYLPPIPTLDEYRGFVSAILLPSQEVWVAEDDEGVVVGWFSVTDGSLEHLYVDPERQNRGLGSEMLAAVMERMPDGFSLWTFQKNEGARRFYERHGLDAVEFTDGRDNMEREPDVRYAWSPATAAPASARADGGRAPSARSRSAGSRSSPRRSP
jgi:ribosomal protein S18 acetylase RimI-like enzyme